MSVRESEKGSTGEVGGQSVGGEAARDWLHQYLRREPQRAIFIRLHEHSASE